MEFVKALISHKLMVLSLLFCSAGLYYFSRDYIKPAYIYINNLPKKFNGILQRNSNKITSINVANEYEKLAKKDKIKLNIRNQIINLNSGDLSKIQTSIQQLLEYPSPDGCIAIVKFATKLPKSIARAELVCGLCNSLETYSDDWYD